MATVPGDGVRSRLYNIWRAMKMRCYNPSHEAYKRYSSAGITVCDEWRDSFQNFRSWALENGYSHELTIDRNDNTKGYYPENCSWETYRVQERNKSKILRITAFGETKLACEWAEDSRCIVSAKNLGRRIASGRDPEWAISTPNKQGIRRKPMSEETKDRIAQKARERQTPRNATTGHFLKQSITP